MPAIEAEVSAADGDVQWGATHEPDASIPSERAVSTSGWGSEDTGMHSRRPAVLLFYHQNQSPNINAAFFLTG